MGARVPNGWWLWALAGTACAAPLGTARTAEVVRPGQWAVDVSTGFRASAAASERFEAARRVARTLKAEPPQVCAEDVPCAPPEDFLGPLEGALSNALWTPYSGDVLISARRGLVTNWEVGGTLRPGIASVLAGYQLFGPEPWTDGWFGTFGPSLSVVFSPSRSVLKQLQPVSQASRHLDLPLIFSHRWHGAGYATLAARYGLSHWEYAVESMFAVASSDGATSSRIPNTDTSGFSHTLGASAAFTIGFRQIFFGLELAAGYEWANPTLAGSPVSISTFSFRPALNVSIIAP